jgi:membrane peptidoglycan carboxypeptidase
VEKLLFETSKKAFKGKKASERCVGWALRFLRFLFNFALIPVAILLTAVSGLYASVTYAYGDQLGRTYPNLVQNSSVYDADGNQVGEFRAKENRRTVGPEDLSKYLS